MPPNRRCRWRKRLQVLSEPCRLLIRQESDEPATIEHQCTASIGIALFVDGDASPDEGAAQYSAMYRARHPAAT